MIEIFSLIGRIFVDTTESDQALKSTDDKAESTGSKMGAVFGKIGSGTAAVGTAVAGAAAVVVGGLTSMATGSAKYADEIDKLSERTGINREELQRWRYAIEQSGGDAGRLEVGIKKLSDQMDAAKNGNTAATQAFDALGISLDDLANMSTEEAFQRVADSLGDMEQGATRNALGNDVLGKSYTELLPLLNAGSEGMNDLKTRADELGLVMSEDAVKSGVVFGDTMDDVQKSLAGTVDILSGSLFPILTKFLNIFLQYVPQIQAFMTQIAPIVMGLLEGILPPLMELAQTLLPIIFGLLEQLLPVFSQIVQAILPIFSELLTMLLPPLVQIIQILLPPLLTILQALLPVLEPLLELIAPFISLLNEIIQLILPPLLALLSKLAEMLGVALRRAFEAIQPAIDGMKNMLSGLISFVRDVFSGNWEEAWKKVSDFFAGIWNGMKDAVKAPLNWIIDSVNRFISGLNMLKLPDWLGGYQVNIPKIPRLQSGIGYVPYDNFPALLHRGERVLTADENEQYTNGRNYSITINQQAQYPMTPEELADVAMRLIEYRALEEVT